MMNRQKTSKAWSWKVATFLPLLALLLMFCGRKSGNEPADNSFQFKDQSFSISRCEIANESFENTSKFEVDFFIEKQGNNLNDTANEKNSIWLSIASKNVSELTDGEYHFSSDNPNKKAAMTFSGAVWVENKKMDINAGDLMCNKQDSDKINITFNLKVDELNELKGNYSGSFRNVNRARIQNVPTPVPKQLTEIKAYSPIFSIEIRKDGNYIENKLCSLEDISKKADLWLKSSPDENLILWLMGTTKSRLSEVEDVLRKAKVQHIDVRVVYLKETIPLRKGQMDVPPSFPGGIMELRKWVAQHIKYPGHTLGKPPQGTVYVRFLINTEGIVKDPAIVKGINPELDEEALRVVSQLPKWKPGEKDGRAINVNFYMPIPFGI